MTRGIRDAAPKVSRHTWRFARVGTIIEISHDSALLDHFKFDNARFLHIRKRQQFELLNYVQGLIRVISAS